MDQLQSFQNFLSTQSTQVSIFIFTLNLLLATILSFCLGKVYIRYGNALSNRRRFAANFLILTVTTTMIITIVKSSLALSLGLVGALSIVRFRAAIKEPEELSYLFLAIAIGLGLGANQQLVTVIGFIVVLAIIRLISMVKIAEKEHNLLVNVSVHKSPHKIKLADIVDILNRHCAEVILRRTDSSAEGFEASFLVEIDGFKRLNQTKEELLRLSDSLRVTIMDNRGLV